MTEKIQLKAVDMVRDIRDPHARMFSGKSKAEITKFFGKAGGAVRSEAEIKRPARQHKQQ